LTTMGQNLGDLNSLAWKVHFNSEVAQSFANIGGFLILGGWAWITKQRESSLDIDEIAPKPAPFTKEQMWTLSSIAILIILVILPGLPATKELFSQTFLSVIGNGKAANVGAIAFLLSCVLLLINAGDSKAAVKSMPWGVIIMVCGMTVLIDVMDKAGGLKALVGMIASISNPTTVNGVLGLVTGVISAYSSSSGVVMPMFLPLVPGLIKQLGGGNAVAMITSINVGAHLVDTSPLSTLGALCIACAADHEDKGKLFRNLLVWGLSMSVVGAILCYVFFGILGF
jgi:di/tricarboxylate transporter